MWCKFGKFFNNMLWDCFMCRLNNAVLLKLLLSEKNLTFMEVVEIAQAAKTVKKVPNYCIVDDVPIGHIRSEVPNCGKASPGSSKPHCDVCDHTADKCHFKQLVCHKCRRLGHIAQVCWSNKAPVVFKPSKTSQEHAWWKSISCQMSKFWMNQFWSSHYLNVEHFLYSQCTVRPGNQSRLLSRWTDPTDHGVRHWYSCVSSPFSHLQQAFS